MGGERTWADRYNDYVAGRYASMRVAQLEEIADGFGDPNECRICAQGELRRRGEPERTGHGR